MSSDSLVAKQCLRFLRNVVKDEDLSWVLSQAQRQLYWEQVLDVKPIPQNTLSEGLLRVAMVFLEADWRAEIMVTPPDQRMHLEELWGWWYLPGQERRIEEARAGMKEGWGG